MIKKKEYDVYDLGFWERILIKMNNIIGKLLFKLIKRKNEKE